LRARLYPADKTWPESVNVPTLENQDGRYPLVEAVLAGEQIQPFIHDCLVKVSRHGRLHRFRVFYKNHKYLLRNGSVPTDVIWKGDILV
ncbi:hypothetical protein BKA70DRAFT_1083051, partial [Coprinopsis sp. MPI-PUGE-AT-0042]